MKYTIADFGANFPDDDSCLDHVFKSKHSGLKGYHKIPGRPAYANKAGHQIYPLVGTIFERSTTPLKLWFFAIYLFSQSKHGVTAMELKRQLGVTYKCAWRMCARIRSLMEEKTPQFSGTVECDEAYVGGKRRLAVGRSLRNKTPVFGMVERGGLVHAETVETCAAKNLLPIIGGKVKRGTRIITDEFRSYSRVRKMPYKKYRHKTVKHGAWEYVRVEGRAKIHTNTIEGFWSGLKREVHGVHHHVSRKHLQAYVNEVTFRYNHRKDGPLFPILLRRLSRPCRGV